MLTQQKIQAQRPRRGYAIKKGLWAKFQYASISRASFLINPEIDLPDVIVFN
jgi:hypothetical protein